MNSSTSNAERRRQIRFEARRRDILATAARLFGEKGYESTTLEDVAEQVGLTKAGLYNYVSSKEQLAVLLLEEVIDYLLVKSAPIMNTEKYPIVKLYKLVLNHISVLADFPASSLLVIQFEHIINRDQYSWVYEKRDGYEHLFRQVIQEGIDEGVFHAGDAKTVGFLILGAMNWVTRWYSPNGDLKPGDVAKQFASVFIGGLIRPHNEWEAGAIENN